MKKRIILVALSIACISSSCTTMNSTTYVPPKVSYDPTIALVSIDGFRVNTSPRTAREVAKGEGYSVSPKLSNLTFEDIINGRTTSKFFRETLYLSQAKSLFRNLNLSFEDGMVCGIELDQAYLDYVPRFLPHRQQAEEALGIYLKRYPSLSLLKEEGELRVYRYQPNTKAFLTVSIQHNYPDEGISVVKISVFDWNYAQSK